ncbi:MAG: DUF4924 family protein [Bacteroidales bacterium]|nr:DUF4924 family protein [Bacteroidales bacterium]
MIVANLKKEENIVEYIIYIRQIQDILRAIDFDINKIEKLIISRYDVDETKKNEIRQWYSNLIIEMKNQNLEVSGDIDEIKKLIEELSILNENLLNTKGEIKHNELYRWAAGNIEEYRKLSKAGKISDVEVCINAVQSLLLLRLKKEPISDETAQAMQTFSNVLANLALEWHSENIK